VSARAIRRRTLSDAALASLSLPPLLARIYAARGVRSAADVDHALTGLLAPETMRGLDAAVARLYTALIDQQSILIIGDYDADGATSSALALLALRAMGAERVEFLVPNRFEYGYGLSPEIVALAAVRKPNLIITVDNGMSSHAGVEHANARGIDVVITDHHLAGPELPAACAIVNPNQPGCAFPSKNLAGVGVVFYLMTALRAGLRERGWFAERAIDVPNLAQFLDLVALGTVADVVPLDRNNRILVQQGLQRIRAGRARPGVLALLALAGRDATRAVSADLAFAAAPRINAAGRLDDMSWGVGCLIEDDAVRAQRMAAELDAMNRERRDIETAMQREALREIDQRQLDETDELPWGLCLYQREWHQGVVGLVASRVKDRLHRPVVAFAPGGAGEIKGSARSIRGFHVRDALASIDARNPGLIARFGGHAMAAGLSMAEANYAAFARAFDDEARRSLDAADMQRVVESDGELGAAELTLGNAELLREIAPWGQHFPPPLFDGEFLIREQRLVGDRHLRLRLSPIAEPAASVAAIAFNIDVNAWPDTRVERIRIAYRLDVNEYRGERQLQLLVEELHAIPPGAGGVDDAIRAQ
jgi:single-stranded-DNA-specific exonuclease